MTGIEEDKNTVTALDYIESQELLEKEAHSVLPGKFEKCTFPLGYIRQPLYACKTCTDSDSKEPAGMCYSCSIACHSSHELFELFPKREFRCDCGLPGKFEGHCCSLMIPAKKIITSNDKNKYNHNFEGRYCRCDQHYDPEKEEGTMYQCVTCEDWFHENCIGDIPEAIDDFDCYVCRDCTKKYPFLINGKDERFGFGLSNGNETISKWILPSSQIVVDVTQDQITIEEKATHEESITDDKETVNEEKTMDEENTVNTNKETPVNEELVVTDIPSPSCGEKRKLEEEQPLVIIANTFKRIKSNEGCQNVDVSLLPKHDHIEIFLQDGWRQGLCKCLKCVQDYKSNNIEYLLVEEKTFEPEEDEDAGKSLLEVGMEQLQRVDRVQALETLMAYKKLSHDIKSYLESFKDSGKTVTKQDIDDFFEASCN
ncbi:hypothetical protein MFLAVUS_003563 [Mucor flavus]|uniref:UBR-type domain-containing protein n=1 Tax=Mucor flavus TaxID=439312 RepID=A0ABP9YTF5_9FUNG